jgi:hypothetical protein
MATCQTGPFPVTGWVVWTGPVPHDLAQFAIRDLQDAAIHPYGYEWQTVYNGEQVIAIKQHHTWTYHGGRLVTGICIPGITLYRQKKIGIEETAVDTTVPNSDIAWFDDGAPVDWVIVTGYAFALVAVWCLFLLALRRMNNRDVK